MNVKHFAILATVTALTGCQTTAGAIDQSQRMLNQLGYNAGAVDGAYGKKTRGALEAFYADNGGAFDGKLDANEVADLQSAMSKAGIRTSALSGVEIENHGTTIFPPINPKIINKRYWWNHVPHIHDFNNDGIQDIWYSGNQRPDQDTVFDTLTHPGDACGRKGFCDTDLAPWTIFLGTKSGNYVMRSDLIIDNREESGHQNSIQNLIADFNDDGVLDIYVADTGFFTRQGFRDSYFLSQPDGTWLESSETHISIPKHVVFNHGAATGDIDGDGDMDVVYTNLSNENLHCLMNDGKGYMKVKTCGKVRAFGLELADMDGDGDLDLLHGSQEDDGGRNYSHTGVSFNNGRGKFSYGSIKLEFIQEYYGIPEISAWDLDDDGDRDIVISRVGDWYKGAAIEILENLGNKKFNSTLYEVVKVPAGVVLPDTEGNEYNAYVQGLRFIDVDRDGDEDVVLFNNGNPKLPEGSYLKNNGGMNFAYVKGGMKVVSENSFKLP